MLIVIPSTFTLRVPRSDGNLMGIVLSCGQHGPVFGHLGTLSAQFDVLITVSPQAKYWFDCRSASLAFSFPLLWTSLFKHSSQHDGWRRLVPDRFSVSLIT